MSNDNLNGAPQNQASVSNNAVSAGNPIVPIDPTTGQPLSLDPEQLNPLQQKFVASKASDVVMSIAPFAVQDLVNGDYEEAGQKIVIMGASGAVAAGVAGTSAVATAAASVPVLAPVLVAAAPFAVPIGICVAVVGFGLCIWGERKRTL